MKRINHLRAWFAVIISSLFILGALKAAAAPLRAITNDIGLSDVEKQRIQRLVAAESPTNHVVSELRFSEPEFTPADHQMKMQALFNPLIEKPHEIELKLGSREVVLQLIRPFNMRTNDDGATKSWDVKLRDENGLANLVTTEAGTNFFVSGSVEVNGEKFEIWPVGNEKVLVMSGVSFPPEHGPAPPATFSTRPGKSAQKKQPEPPKEPSVLRVLFVYTPAVREAVADIRGPIQDAVDAANKSFSFPAEAMPKSNGNIDRDIWIRLEIAEIAEATNYVESAGMAKDLARFQDPNDGFMDEIHPLRNKNKADLCVLLVEGPPQNQGYNLCGIASSIYATPSSAFCIVKRTCFKNFSIAHEIGHLLGARHNPEIDKERIPFADGHGAYRTNNWRCIMSYLGNATDGKTPRMNFWSTPEGTFRGEPMGGATQNNVRALNLTAPEISQFR